MQILSKLKQVMIPALREQGKKEMRNCTSASTQGTCGDPFCCAWLYPCNPSLTQNPVDQNQGQRRNHLLHHIHYHVGRLSCRGLQRQVPGSRNVIPHPRRSVFQSACLLGYCVFPINIAALVTAIFGSVLPALIRLGLVAFSFVWSSMCT